MKRNIVCAVLLLTMLVLLCACGKSNVESGIAEITAEPAATEMPEVVQEKADRENPDPESQEPEIETADPSEGAEAEKTAETAEPAAETEPAAEPEPAAEAEPAADAEPETEPVTEAETVAEPEPSKIEITVPAKYTDVSYRVGEVTWNADDSATYRLTEEEHERLLAEVHNDIQRKLDEMCASSYFMDFDSITANDDCTVFTVVCLSIETSRAEQESLSKIYDFGRMYAAYRGEEPGNIHLDFMTKIGNTFVMRDSHSDILAK